MPSRSAEQLDELLDNTIWFPELVVNLNLQESGNFLQIVRDDFELGPLESGKLTDVHV
ncbi:hypothetical protein BCEN4_1090066 [Burkholderia cenocepacia]|nr:hypothetical protein BCEN4_1090066 [Burkholderia cenocepacia]